MHAYVFCHAPIPSFLKKYFIFIVLIFLTLFLVVIQFESNNKKSFSWRGRRVSRTTQVKGHAWDNLYCSTEYSTKKVHILYLPFQVEVSSYTQSAIKCYYCLYSFSRRTKLFKKKANVYFIESPFICWYYLIQLVNISSWLWANQHFLVGIFVMYKVIKNLLAYWFRIKKVFLNILFLFNWTTQKNQIKKG